MNRKKPFDAALLYSNLEERVSRHPVRAIRLTGTEPEPLGLLVIGNHSSGAEVAAALAGLRLPDQLRPETDGRDSGKTDAQAWFRSQLAAELARTRETRLPCALLLVSVSGQVPVGSDSLAEQAEAALAPSLPPGEVLSIFQRNILGLFMPGATVGKARKRAENVCAILRSGAFLQEATGVASNQHPDLTLGIAVCHAYAPISADQLLLLAKAELARAARMGCDAISYSAALRAEDSCQVTVEERAQLWQQS
jgi:hypothetical protein